MFAAVACTGYHDWQAEVQVATATSQLQLTTGVSPWYFAFSALFTIASAFSFGTIAWITVKFHEGDRNIEASVGTRETIERAVVSPAPKAVAAPTQTPDAERLAVND